MAGRGGERIYLELPLASASIIINPNLEKETNRNVMSRCTRNLHKERMGRYHIMRIEEGLSALVCNSGGAFGSASKDR